MFVWMSGFQNLLAHTHFDMFVDEWMSANESPVIAFAFGPTFAQCEWTLRCHSYLRFIRHEPLRELLNSSSFKNGYTTYYHNHIASVNVPN